MTDDEDEKDRGECGQYIAISEALARHVEALGADVTDDEVNAFIGGCGLFGHLLKRGRVQRLLNDLIAQRQRRGQLAAFEIDG